MGSLNIWYLVIFTTYVIVAYGQPLDGESEGANKLRMKRQAYGGAPKEAMFRKLMEYLGSQSGGQNSMIETLRKLMLAKQQPAAKPAFKPRPKVKQEDLRRRKLPGTDGQSENTIPGSVLGIQEDCVRENSQGACEKCQVNAQCKEGMTCCPTMKVCVKGSCSECKGSPSAKCRPGCFDHMVHSQYQPCSCANTQFPDYWAPQCGSLYDNDTKQFIWKPKTDVFENKCHPKWETKHKEKCEEYVEEHCPTTHEEKCEEVSVKNCEPIRENTQERKCVDVVEKHCTWRKKMNHEFVEDMITIQRCHQTKRRVCDTTFRFDSTTTDTLKCVEVEKPKCEDEWKTIYDKTCRKMWEFDCRTPPIGNGYGDTVLQPQREVKRYKTHPGMPADWPTPHNGQIPKFIDKEIDQFKCKRTPYTRCHKTPRSVKFVVCKQVKEKKCEKITNRNPNPIEQQTCHNDPYEECETVKEPQKKYISIPTYTKECIDVPKKQCDNAGDTVLKVACVDKKMPKCEWTPTQLDCQKIRREHCYQIPYLVKVTDCSESYSESDGALARALGRALNVNLG